MKIRVGFGLGTRTTTNDADRMSALAEGLERRGFDSLWLSERVGSDAPDPLMGLAFAAARTSKLKLGTSVLVVPGRNPVLLAKELASLDRLSGGRLLPAFGLGVADPHEQAAFGVSREERASRFDEALSIMRRLWAGEEVVHHGHHFELDGVRIGPPPVQPALDVWLGGIAPSELRRVGRCGDGWLPSFCTPDEAASGRAVIERTAAEHDRHLDPEHFGALVAYRDGPLPDVLAAFVARRRPGLDPAELIPTRGALRATLERFVDVGTSKFVVVPVHEPPSWEGELDALASDVLPMQV